MKRFFGFFCLLMIVSLAFLMNRKPMPPDRIETSDVLAHLSEMLKGEVPGSPEAAHLVERIVKIKNGDLEEDEAPTEQPDALLEAFAQIKSGPDGRRYRIGYQQRELTRAYKSLTRKRAARPWVERGPGNVSGRVRVVVVDPGDPGFNTWFVATIGGGIWKTTDGGANWRELTKDLATLSTTCLVQAASNPNVLYAGTGMGYGRIVDLKGSGIWKSVDRGESWFQLAATADGQILEAINRIVVDPNNENILLACSNDGFSHLGPKGGVRKSGIFRSSDGGQSWSRVFDPEAVFGSVPDNRVQQIIATPGNFNLLYASVNEVGVVKSTDGGLTWSVSADYFALPSDIGNPPANGFGLAGVSVRTELAVSPTDPNRLYAAVERPRGVADLYMSKNAGNSWILVPDTGNDPNWFNGNGVSGANGSYTAGWFDNTITVHPYNANVVFVGGVNIYRLNIDDRTNSRTSSLSAFRVPNPFGVAVVHADHHWLQAVPTNPGGGQFLLINANDGGLAVSSDGGQNWSSRVGMRSTQFYGVSKKPGENVYFGGTQDNGTWLSAADPDALSQWRSTFGGDGFETAWHINDPNLMLGGSQNNGLQRSRDGGQTWVPVVDTTLGNGPFITKIAYSGTDPDLVFAISSAGVFRSDDFGASWTLTRIGPNWLGYRPFDNVEISQADPQIVWISSRMDIDPPAGIPGGIHVSSDSGLSFRHVSANFPPNLTESSGMGLDPRDPQTAYMLFSAPGQPKILRTRDLGNSWEDVTRFGNGSSAVGFPDVAVFSLIAMPYDPDILWVGTEIGLFVSEDGGASWSFDDSFPHVAVFQLSIWEDQVLAATQGRGIWSVSLPELENNQLPLVTLSPRLLEAAYQPTGNMALTVDLRSAYDETRLLVDGLDVDGFGPNQIAESRTLLYPMDRDGTVNIQVIAKKDGRDLLSSQKQVRVYGKDARTTYNNSFNDLNNNDFDLSGFSLVSVPGFADPILRSLSPYPNGSFLTATLKYPILIPDGPALLSYDDVALVEPGGGSGVFGDPLFFDFVVVEGTNDGVNWVPLADGYDARFNSTWLNTFNNGGNPNASMFVSHSIDLRQNFLPGEQIFIRFSLFGDPGLAGWGWAVDNLKILDDAQGEPQTLEFETLYPWVSHNERFESLLVVNNTGDSRARYTLTARRESGCGERIAGRYLEPGAFLIAPVNQLFTHVDAGPGLAVVLASDSPGLKGRWVTNNLDSATGRSPSQGVGIDLEAVRAGRSELAGSSLLFNFLPQTEGLTAAPVIVNLGEAPTDVSLSFFRRDGTLVLRDETSLVGLQPNRPFARVANTLVPGGDEDLYLLAESDGMPISGVTFVFNDLGETAIGNATGVVPGDTADSDLMYAWISNNADFESILIANNLGENEVTLNLTARRAEGMPESVTATVPAHGFLRETAASLFPALGDGRGYTVTLNADQPNIYGGWVTNNLKAASGRSPAQGVAVRIPGEGAVPSQRVGETILFGFLPVTQGFISAPVVVNLHGEAVDVSLFFYNREGVLVLEDHGTLLGLAPGRPFATVVNTLIPELEEDVYLVARSSGGPISGVAFVFNQGAEPAIGNVTSLDP